MFGLLDYLKIGAGFLVGVMLTGGAIRTYDKLIAYPAVAHEARQGYVAEAETMALRAQLKEIERQRSVAQAATEAAQKREAAARKEAEDAQAKYLELVASDSGSDGPRVDRSDIEWMSKH